MTRIEELARKLNQEILALEVVQEYQKYEKLVLNDEKLKQLEKELKVLQKKIVNQKAKQDDRVTKTIQEYQEKKEQEKVVHEPTGSYGMDTITMRQKIMERVMLMEENQLKEMLALVDEAEKVLVDKQSDLDEFGRLLDHKLRIKRKTGNTVSTNSIDELYDKGLKAGALGGKLLGAGGGGFLVFYVEPDKQEKVKKAMEDLLYIPFEFEDGGTRVIHYSPETYEPII